MPFYPEKLVIGVLISDLKLQSELLDQLEINFGIIDFKSSVMDFNFTHYYDEEMGIPIKRLFFSFKDLIDPSVLAEIKIKTNNIENMFRVQNRRKINLDPGLLCLSRFILATTKDSSHRIPLQSGIFAEITLMYEHNHFRPVEWTYPDYSNLKYLETLKTIRNIYKKQLKFLAIQPC